MGTFAIRSAKWTLDVITRLVKANVRVHNAEVFQPDMSAICVINHFTRLETLLLPYYLNKHTGLEFWSLAASELFKGRLAGYLNALYAVSTKDPDRDKFIVHSLLSGKNPWIIFPEGGMIKDKKVVDSEGFYQIWSGGVRRAPHSGAAVLGLRAEFYRHKLECLDSNPEQGDMAPILEHFGLESIEQALNRRTVIIPVNVTYFPIRSRENVFLRIAQALNKELSERAVEELSLEGTVLAEDTDIDITLGEPIDVASYLCAPEYEPLMACGPDDLQHLEEDPRSLFHEAARDLTQRFMDSIYRLTTINYDHLLATIIRYQEAPEFTERAYRNRVFLCVHRLRDEKRYRLHELLEERYRDILYEEPFPHFYDFMNLCVAEGIIQEKGGRYYKDFNVTPGHADFHSIRLEEPTYVLANEVEPLREVVEVVRDYARMPRPALSTLIREILMEEDQAIFEQDLADYPEDELILPMDEAEAYAEDSALPAEETPVSAEDVAHLSDDEEGDEETLAEVTEEGDEEDRPGPVRIMRQRDPEVGRPYLLVPERIRAGVVLIHGYLSAPREVLELAEFLESHNYAVYAVRMKGHGTSPADLAKTQWEEWYESLNRGYAIIKSLTDDIILGGFSTGGTMALYGAGRKKGKIQSVFAINAPLQLRRFSVRLAPSLVSVNAFLKRFRRNKAREGRWEYVPNHPENPDINYLRNPVRGVRELGKAMGAMEGVLPDIVAPTLVLQASHDPIVDPVSAQMLFYKVGTPHKELVMLDRRRHGIINGDGAEDVFGRVLEFLQWAREKKAEASQKEAPLDVAQGTPAASKEG